jgi:uncharacterized coiled-coil protein SlyX
MATPLSADRLLSSFWAEGVNVAESSGWRTHNRNHKGPWGPVNGIVIHHTAGSNSLNLCINGMASLPGPLCHTHLDKRGKATMTGYGRANHAGNFAQNAHDAVVAENSHHPRPDSSEPVDGNQHYYGIEIENRGDGSDPYPAVQYEAAVRWAAAICRAHGWSEESVIGHKEGTRRKIDPSFDMDTFRKKVGERLAHSADWTPGDEEDPLSGMTPKDIATAVLKTDNVIDIPTDWDPGNAAWTLATFQVDAGKRLRNLEKQVAAQNAAVGELVKTVAQLAANAQAIDPDALVARIQGAIESVTVRLDVPDA